MYLNPYAHRSGHAVIRSLTIPRAPAAALAFAAHLDRQADVLLCEGRAIVAERLSHVAAEARTLAAGGAA